MKWKLLLLFGITGLATASAQTREEIEKELSSVNLFSIGFNGFVAKKMPQEITYEKALKSNESVSIFNNVMESNASTPEAKAYAACGLWESKKSEKIKLKDEYNNLNVTVLIGDILRKESLGRMIGNIKAQGCK